MERDTHETPCIIKRFKNGDPIAIFPSLPGTNDPHTCDSYMVVGQHGSASIYLLRDLQPVDMAADDVQRLIRELTNVYGYRLKFYKRRTRKHDAERYAALNRQAA